MNKVILVGYLGRSFELKGKTIYSSALATTRKYKNKTGELIKDTQWHNIVSFGKQGETLSKYTTKGSKMLIEGRLAYRQHEGKMYTSVVVESFEFLSVTGNKNKTNEYKEANRETATAGKYETGEIPF